MSGSSVNFSFPCNTVGFPTNKGKKPPKITIPLNRLAKHYKDLNIAVLKPDIDRITFGFSPTHDFLAKYDTAQDLNEYKEHIKKSLYQDATADSENTGLSLVEGVPFKKKPYCNYNVNLRYKPSGSKESIFIQIDPKDPASNLAFMRFDMNPSRFEKDAFTKFRLFIEDTLHTTAAPVPYGDFLIWAKIYRADVCVDILGARPYDLEIKSMANKKPSPQKSHTYKSKTGRLETVYPKVKPKGKPSTEYVYDKRKEQIDDGKQPQYGDFFHSRYECRVQKTTFYKLSNIKNRCVRISVRALDYSKYDKTHYTGKLFIRHALDRGVEKALEIIPDKFQPKFKKQYDAVMQNIWDAKKLWSHWKDKVENSGFF